MFNNLFKRNLQIPTIKLYGVIGGGGRFKNGLTLSNLSKLIDKAFSFKKIPAVALMINSPGGSPTQSSFIASKIKYLANKKNVKVYAFVEDVAASGGYWLACVADKIFVNENSIVGSIGVVSPGFGFVQMIKKLGIERRIFTSGKNKSFLDPFEDVKSEDLKRLKKIQEIIHKNFIDHVKKNRSNKIKSKDKDIFNGLFWIGRDSIKLGLADEIGNAEEIMKKKFGEKTKLKIIEPKKSFIQRKFSSKLPSTFFDGHELTDVLEEKAYWSRFGL